MGSGFFRSGLFNLFSNHRFPFQTEMEPSSSDFHRDVDYVLLCGCHIHLGWKSDLYMSLLYFEA
jgi:hypothetical protein